MYNITHTHKYKSGHPFSLLHFSGGLQEYLGIPSIGYMSYPSL